MAKQRASLELIVQATQEPAPQSQPAPGAGGPVAARPEPAVEKPRGMRKDKPHTTLYLGKKARKVVKEIALQFDTTPQALYLEGIDMMLTKYGRPNLDELKD
jgi:hypothetical protein